MSLTGLAEIAGAIGLLVPRLAPAPALGHTLLLVAVFPANVYAARAGLSVGGAGTELVPRILEQLSFLAFVLLAGFDTAG